jgi:hypothetical protein
MPSTKAHYNNVPSKALEDYEDCLFNTPTEDQNEVKLAIIAHHLQAIDDLVINSMGAEDLRYSNKEKRKSVYYNIMDITSDLKQICESDK